jgi:hypothetical protein
MAEPPPPVIVALIHLRLQRIELLYLIDTENRSDLLKSLFDDFSSLPVPDLKLTTHPHLETVDDGRHLIPLGRVRSSLPVNRFIIISLR